MCACSYSVDVKEQADNVKQPMCINQAVRPSGQATLVLDSDHTCTSTPTALAAGNVMLVAVRGLGQGPMTSLRVY